MQDELTSGIEAGLNPYDILNKNPEYWYKPAIKQGVDMYLCMAGKMETLPEARGVWVTGTERNDEVIQFSKNQF